MRETTLSGVSSTIARSAPSASVGRAGLLVGERRQLVLLDGVGDQPQPLEDLRQLEVSLDVARRQLEDVLVDRDRFLEKALLGVKLAGLEIDLGRLVGRATLGMQFRHLEPGARVLGVLLDHLGEFGQRLVELPSLQKLLSGGEGLVLFSDHERLPVLPLTPWL